MHGFTDYCGRFAHVGKVFSSLGYDFIGLDQRGHGKSEGQLARVPSMEEVSRDTAQFHEKVYLKYYAHLEP